MQRIALLLGLCLLLGGSSASADSHQPEFVQRMEDAKHEHWRCLGNAMGRVDPLLSDEEVATFAMDSCGVTWKKLLKAMCWARGGCTAEQKDQIRSGFRGQFMLELTQLRAAGLVGSER